MRNKVLAVILAVLLTFTVLPIALAAELPTITVSSASAKPGDSVTLKVSLKNNPGINTFSLGFEYDTSRLSLTAVSLESGVGGQFAYSKKAVWLNSSDSVYNGDYLSLSFKVLDNAAAGNASVSVVYNKGDISNYNEDDVDFTVVAGAVTIEKEIIEAGTISVSSVTAAAASEAKVAVSISGNPGINTFSLGFDYDTTRLNLKSVVPTAELGGQFTYSKKAVWLNSSDTTYNGEILILTFDVLENAAEGDARVAVTYSAGDISNYNEDDVDFNLTAGKITVTADPAPSVGGKIKVQLSDDVIRAGDEFTVTLALESNPGMAGLIATMKYDAEAFTLVSTENGDVFTSLTAARNLVWSDSNGENTTVNGALATLTFRALEETAVGEYTFDLTVRECTNATFDDIELGVESSKLNVIDFIYGDANDDGLITIKDVVLISQYFANFDYDSETSDVVVGAGADANGDGRITVKDMVILNQYLANFDYDTNTSSVVLGPVTA